MTIILCSGDLDECQNCGGSNTLGGTQHPVENGRGGRYCSTDCLEEADEFQARARAEHERRFACCPACGYDNAEHAPGCEGAAPAQHGVR